MKRRFVCYFWYVDWLAFSFGFHIDLRHFNIEIHLPVGFIKVGFERYSPDWNIINEDEVSWRKFGL